MTKMSAPQELHSERRQNNALAHSYAQSNHGGPKHRHNSSIFFIDTLPSSSVGALPNRGLAGFHNQVNTTNDNQNSDNHPHPTVQIVTGQLGDRHTG